MPQFGKRTVLTKAHFDEFYQAVGSDLTQIDETKRQAFIDNHRDGSDVGDVDTCRLRCFSREEITAKEDSLDLAWIRDDSIEDAANLPEPDFLINEAIEELAGAITDLQSILVELDAAVETDESFA